MPDATNSSTREVGHWRHDDLNLIRDSNGRPIWNIANAIIMLSEHPEWQGVLGFNEFTRRRMLMRDVPGQFGGRFPRVIEDDDYSAALAWFNFNGFPRAKTDLVRDAIRKTCRDHGYDPLKDYLSGLEWDGKTRLTTWLTDFCGVEPSEYVAEVGKRWAISAVARGLRPGCKVDSMLVLEGPQGQRKSSAIAALAGVEWFSDSLPQMGSKDASAYLAGKWIVEVGELEAMRRDMDAIKAFLTRQVERYRPAYGREEVEEPRRCVFAGTTNKNDWQRDETGGRRFWPVIVGEIDIEGLKAARDQLWAEAVHLFRNGERWWLEGDIAQVANEEVAQRRADDPWRSEIAEKLHGKSQVTAKEILAELGVHINEMNPALSKRIATELVGLGWVRSGKITSGQRRGQVVFVPREAER